MAQNAFRRQTRPKKKTMQHISHQENIRRTIYICDIASKASPVSGPLHAAAAADLSDVI